MVQGFFSRTYLNMKFSNFKINIEIQHKKVKNQFFISFQNKQKLVGLQCIEDVGPSSYELTAKLKLQCQRFQINSKLKGKTVEYQNVHMKCMHTTNKHKAVDHQNCTPHLWIQNDSSQVEASDEMSTSPPGSQHDISLISNLHITSKKKRMPLNPTKVMD